MLKVIICLFSLFSYAAYADAVQPLQFAPDDANFTAYTAFGKSVSLHVKNFDPGTDTDRFPEPPLIITHILTQKNCEIESGIWPRNGFILVQDESLLIAEEYSGSNSDLAVYFTSDCQRANRISVTDHGWEVTPHSIKIGSECSEFRNINSCQSRADVPFLKQGRYE